ncbi:MAG TPA: hypothetical protein VMU15_12490 [Anaeromyxobacter sp.]|nr:hypothetical protein [Anaeromyxobacter sp.]
MPPSSPTISPRGPRSSPSIAHGEELARHCGDPSSGAALAAARAPDVLVQPNWGVIYSGSSKKIAEHGGGTLDDTHVALLASNPHLRPARVHERVSTAQVAPTILRAPGLDPEALEAVGKERTRVLPGLGFG